MNPACKQHSALVHQVLNGAPSEADLIAYAEEVPGCAACQQVLAVANGVHPRVLQQGGSDSGSAAWAQLSADPAMERLAEAMQERSSRSNPAFAPMAAVALAAAAAGLFWVMSGSEPVPVPAVPAPAEVAVEMAQPSPEPEVPAVLPPEAPPSRPSPTPPAVHDDAVVDAQVDWEPPAWQDLRPATHKGSVAPLSVGLILGKLSPSVGDVVPLTVVSSRPTQLTICVQGPERGVVWRGNLPEGRTALTQGDDPVAYSFSKAGEYRFQLSTTDDPACSKAETTTLVEVR